MNVKWYQIMFLFSFFLIDCSRGSFPGNDIYLSRYINSEKPQTWISRILLRYQDIKILRFHILSLRGRMLYVSFTIYGVSHLNVQSKKYIHKSYLLRSRAVASWRLSSSHRLSPPLEIKRNIPKHDHDDDDTVVL